MTYHTHIDSLKLSFNTIDSLNFVHSKSNNYMIKPISSKLNYRYSYDIYAYLGNRMIRFASIDLLHSARPIYSVLELANEALYYPCWSNILNQIVYDFKLDITIRKLELAIDINTNILKKLHTIYMKSNKLIINDLRYDFDNYGKTKFVKAQGYKHYFNNTATQYLMNDKTQTRCQYDRFENKTNEINQSSHKPYILDYLAQHLDINKTVFRFEKTLFFEDLSYSNKIYLNTSTGEILSKHHYKKLHDAFKSGYIESIEYSKMDIDFNKLEDHSYLTSLFNHFALFNHEIIIDTYTNTPHFKANYVKHYSIVKPNNRSITIANSKQHIDIFKAEFDRINQLYTIEKVDSLEVIKQRELDILFNTPIPHVRFAGHSHFEQFPNSIDWLH
jgi:hypothetical protein